MIKQQQSENAFVRPSFVFFHNGICSLLGWNALLSSLDYFQYVYSNYDVYSWFPLLINISYIITGLSFHYISNKISYPTLIKLGLIITNTTLIILFLLSIFFTNHQKIGFFFSLFICFVLGIGSNLAQLSFYALINYLGSDVVSTFNVGTGVSGILFNFIRIILISIIGSEQSNITPIIIYFCLSTVYNLFDLFLNIAFFKTNVYNNLVLKQTPFYQTSLYSTLNQKSSPKSYTKIMIQTAKQISPFTFYILANYIITFMLFPGPSVKKVFNWSFVWSSLIFITCFNLGDTIGRITGSYRKTFNSISILFLLLGRLYFFFTISIIANGTSNGDILIDNNVFPFVILFLFGFTNGYLTNACFILCFQSATVDNKEYAGVMAALCLQFGIVIGSILEVPFAMIAID